MMNIVHSIIKGDNVWGKQVIKPDELEDMDTEESYVSENKKYVESVLASRDNIKIRKKSTKHDVELCILGMESQEHIHYAMPMRVMGYDYGSYKKQYDSNAVKYKTEKGLSDDEFISKMKRTDKFIPIITIVIYYGRRLGMERYHYRECWIFLKI